MMVRNFFLFLHTGIEYYKKYPYCLGIDVTFGTNREKRPLFRVTVRTPNRHVLPILEAFLPSQQQWVFKLIIDEVFPQLLHKKYLDQTKIVVTDEDEKMFLPIRQAIQSNRLGNGAKHRLCKWHKINRNYTQKVQ